MPLCVPQLRAVDADSPWPDGSRLARKAGVKKFCKKKNYLSPIGEKLFFGGVKREQNKEK